jgi:hypothetical protein
MRLAIVLLAATALAARAQAPAVNATLSPAAGTLTNNGVAQVAGSVGGGSPPFTVTFVVDGAIESQITGLTAGEQFRHGISVVGDGPHAFSVRARNAAGQESTSALGSITLDRTPPAAPILLNPQPISSNQNTLTLKGFHPEPPRPGMTQQPKILVMGPPQVTFTPAQPQTLTDPSGMFETVANVAQLPDGTYTFRIIAIDAAGNFSSTTRLELGSRKRRSR